MLHGVDATAAMLDHLRAKPGAEHVRLTVGDFAVFVIEALVPDPTLYDRGQRVSALRVEPDRVQLDASRH